MNKSVLFTLQLIDGLSDWSVLIKSFTLFDR